MLFVCFIRFGVGEHFYFVYVFFFFLIVRRPPRSTQSSRRQRQMCIRDSSEECAREDVDGEHRAVPLGLEGHRPVPGGGRERRGEQEEEQHRRAREGPVCLGRGPPVEGGKAVAKERRQGHPEDEDNERAGEEERGIQPDRLGVERVAHCGRARACPWVKSSQAEDERQEERDAWDGERAGEGRGDWPDRRPPARARDALDRGEDGAAERDGQPEEGGGEEAGKSVPRVGGRTVGEDADADSGRDRELPRTGTNETAQPEGRAHFASPAVAVAGPDATAASDALRWSWRTQRIARQRSSGRTCAAWDGMIPWPRVMMW